MDSAPEQAVGEQLGSGERLLWAGRPRQGIILRPSDALAIPFSIFWAGFAVFWVVMASRSPDKVFPLFGVPFVAIGLYMLVGRFFVDSWQRAKTTYGLTDRRIVIIQSGRNRRVKSLSLRTLSDVTLSEKADGSGTITFGPTASYWPNRGIQMPGVGAPLTPSFDSIDNARNVFEQIRRAQS